MLIENEESWPCGKEDKIWVWCRRHPCAPTQTFNSPLAVSLSCPSWLGPQIELSTWTVSTSSLPFTPIHSHSFPFSHQSVQLLSSVWLFVIPTAACQASLSWCPITNSWSLLKLMSIESVMLSTIIPRSSPCPLAFNLSQHQGLFQCPFFTSSLSWNLDFIPTTVRREH